MALLVALRPVRKAWRAADVDARLGFGDRLATAWAFRHSNQSTVVALQRSDAITQLRMRAPRGRPEWRLSRIESGALAAACLLTLVLLVAPSPQQAVLDRQTAEQLAVQQTTARLDQLREEATGAPSLTPDQARRLDELLRQAHAELAGVRTQREATAILARAEEQVGQQLADPDSQTRDEALAAMSETLAAEPLAQSLGAALQHEDASAASDALKTIASQADSLSDVQRQALSRALQRAANVGRSDPQSASALRTAAQAVSAGQPADAALSAADAALRQSIQAATAQANLRQTSDRLRDLEAQLAASTAAQADARQVGSPRDPSGVPLGTTASVGVPSGTTTTAGIGTPVALDANASRLSDPSADRGPRGGVGGADSRFPGQPASAVQPAENVFVAGRPGNGPADQDLTDQPFSIRGEPRPYREVLGQYAQSGREYVDRPDVSPAVRDLVKNYFQHLEEGQ